MTLGQGRLPPPACRLNLLGQASARSADVWQIVWSRAADRRGGLLQMCSTRCPGRTGFAMPQPSGGGQNGAPFAWTAAHARRKAGEKPPPPTFYSCRTARPACGRCCGATG